MKLRITILKYLSWYLCQISLQIMLLERFSYDLEKWFRYSVRYLFHQPISEKIKTWTLRFPAKENPNMVKALFDWPIVLQYDVKAKYRLISRKFLGMTFFHPSVRLTNQKLTRVCIRSINQSNRSIFVRLFFLFCLRVFISRSYENRSTCTNFKNHFVIYM